MVLKKDDKNIITLGFKNWYKPTPKSVDIVSSWFSSVLLFVAGYSAFQNNTWLVFSCMVGNLTMDKLIKPLFGSATIVNEPLENK